MGMRDNVTIKRSSRPVVSGQNDPSIAMSWRGESFGGLSQQSSTGVHKLDSVQTMELWSSLKSSCAQMISKPIMVMVLLVPVVFSIAIYLVARNVDGNPSHSPDPRRFQSSP